jgi:hypothetical protein
LLMILAFIWWWPLGLVILAFMIGSGRMGCRHGMERGMSHGNWQEKGMSRWQGNWQEKMERVRASGRGGCGFWGSPPSSGNRAFDDYRTETLKRLEEEQREFREFLERLRFAKDKTEFDAFMAERRDRTAGPAPDSGPQPQS